jgi:HK97 family phage prohead protease
MWISFDKSAGFGVPIVAARHAGKTEGADGVPPLGAVIEIDGKLSTFGNEDRDGDYISPQAFDSLDMQRFPLLLDHERSTRRQVGSFSASVRDGGLWIAGEFLVTPETVHEAMLILSGHLHTLSMGGRFRWGDPKNHEGRSVIEEVRLHEGSIVSTPANTLAVFVATLRQSAEGVPAGETGSGIDRARMVRGLIEKKLREGK